MIFVVFHLVLHRLLMFFDGVECLSFELHDLEDEDAAAALETRLKAVAPHAIKVFHFHMQVILSQIC